MHRIFNFSQESALCLLLLKIKTKMKKKMKKTLERNTKILEVNKKRCKNWKKIEKELKKNVLKSFKK